MSNSKNWAGRPLRRPHGTAATGPGHKSTASPHGVKAHGGLTFSVVSKTREQVGNRIFAVGAHGRSGGLFVDTVIGFRADERPDNNPTGRIPRPAGCFWMVWSWAGIHQGQRGYEVFSERNGGFHHFPELHGLTPCWLSCLQIVWLPRPCSASLKIEVTISTRSGMGLSVLAPNNGQDASFALPANWRVTAPWAPSNTSTFGPRAAPRAARLNKRRRRPDLTTTSGWDRPLSPPVRKIVV